MRQCRRFAATVASILFLALHTASASAQNKPFETAEKVPTAIHHVAAGGFWTLGKEEGFFRAVVVAGGVEHVSHRLFIQWLRSDAKTQGYQLVRTVNVKELNLGHGFVLEVKTAFGDINSFKIDITANSRGGKAKNFAITARGDGKYMVQAR